MYYLQRGALGSFSVVVHASGDTDALARHVTSEIRSMNQEASIRRTLDEMFSSSTAGRRFNFTLLTTFAGSALMLALLGI